MTLGHRPVVGRRQSARRPATRPGWPTGGLGTGINVAEAKPGDTDFNGGRWLVYTVTWMPGVTPVQYTNDGQILAAQDAGLLTINPDPVKASFCNVAPVPGSPSGH